MSIHLFIGRRRARLADCIALHWLCDLKVGKDGFRSCTEVYPRCLLDLETLLGTLRRQHISFQIPGQQRDCEVFLLWTKKKDNITRIEN